MLQRRRSFRVEHIDLKRLDGESIRRVIAQISDVVRVCWLNTEMDEIYERVDRQSVDNRLWLVRGPDEAVVGFMHGVSEDMELDGTKVLMMRSMGAVYPEWRAALGGFERYGAGAFVKVALRGRLRGRLPILFAFFSTPATYRTFIRVMPRVVPSPGKAPDPKLLRLRDAAAAHFGLAFVPGRAHTCREGRQEFSPEEREHWKNHPAPEIRFFVEQCPNYGEGDHLVGIVPMDWIDLARAPLHASIGVAREWLRRRRRRWGGGKKMGTVLTF